MKRICLLAVAVAALTLTASPFARSFSTRSLSDAHIGSSKAELLAQRDYSGRVFRRLSGTWQVAPRHATCWSHVPWSKVCDRARSKMIAHRWLHAVASRRLARLYPERPQLSGEAAWYADGATQCEVDHEGGWTSVSPYGYAGRFQSDYSFETSTPFGASMEARYGRANNWPPWAQIHHAYEVWLTRGWGPWPPYYKYGCAAYHGRSYT